MVERERQQQRRVGLVVIRDLDAPPRARGAHHGGLLGATIASRELLERRRVVPLDREPEAEALGLDGGEEPVEDLGRGTVLVPAEHEGLRLLDDDAVNDAQTSRVHAIVDEVLGAEPDGAVPLVGSSPEAHAPGRERTVARETCPACHGREVQREDGAHERSNFPSSSAITRPRTSRTSRSSAITRSSSESTSRRGEGALGLDRPRALSLSRQRWHVTNARSLDQTPPDRPHTFSPFRRERCVTRSTSTCGGPCRSPS